MSAKDTNQEVERLLTEKNNELEVLEVEIRFLLNQIEAGKLDRKLLAKLHRIVAKLAKLFWKDNCVARIFVINVV